MAGERIERGGAESRPHLAPDLRRHAAPEELGEHRDVAGACAQRRQRHHFERKPVEQVGTEGSRRHTIGQMLVGRRHDPHIDMNRPGGADPRHLAIFNRPQQPVLRRHRQRPQLVQEQGTAIGFLEPAGARLGGAGEGAGLVPEQLGLDQRLRQRRAVHHHQRLVPAGRQAVQTLGHQLLAGPALADHQYRSIQRRRAAGPFQRVEEGRRLADDLGRALHAGSLAQFPNC